MLVPRVLSASMLILLKKWTTTLIGIRRAYVLIMLLYKKAKVANSEMCVHFCTLRPGQITANISAEGHTDMEHMEHMEHMEDIEVPAQQTLSNNIITILGHQRQFKGNTVAICRRIPQVLKLEEHGVLSEVFQKELQ